MQTSTVRKEMPCSLSIKIAKQDHKYVEKKYNKKVLCTDLLAPHQKKATTEFESFKKFSTSHSNNFISLRKSCISCFLSSFLYLLPFCATNMNHSSLQVPDQYLSTNKVKMRGVKKKSFLALARLDQHGRNPVFFFWVFLLTFHDY